jgi:hypothetical protein
MNFEMLQRIVSVCYSLTPETGDIRQLICKFLSLSGLKKIAIDSGDNASTLYLGEAIPRCRMKERSGGQERDARHPNFVTQLHEAKLSMNALL